MFFSRNESRFDGIKGNVADDLDLIVSPKDGKLVGVVQNNGVHVCWQCFEQFVDDATHPLRPIEFNPGGENTRFLVHSKCVEPAAKALRKLVDSGVPGDTMFWDVVKGHQMRRLLTKVTKPFRKDG